jgi:hypothetical protein
MHNGLFTALAICAALSFSACTTSSVAPAPTSTVAAPESAPADSRPSPVEPALEQKRSVPAGTILRVRLYNAIDSGRSRSGDAFVASLSAPVTVDEKTILPKGTVVHGIIRQISSSGRLKGRASVTLALDRMEWNGADVPIDTNSITLTSADHKKRNLAWIGGSSAAGALIGGLLGGGKGALIGAGAGGAAGVGTAAATGRRQIRVPAESLLTFRLAQPVAI